MASRASDYRTVSREVVNRKIPNIVAMSAEPVFTSRTSDCRTDPEGCE